MFMDEVTLTVCEFFHFEEQTIFVSNHSSHNLGYCSFLVSFSLISHSSYESAQSDIPRILKEKTLKFSENSPWKEKL